MIRRFEATCRRTVIIGSQAGFGFAFTASMPANDTPHRTGPADFARLAPAAPQAANELLAHSVRQRAGRAVRRSGHVDDRLVLHRLEDGLYQGEKLDRHHRVEGSSA